MRVDRKALLRTKEKPATKKNLLIAINFDKTLSDMEKAIGKHWHMLSFIKN